MSTIKERISTIDGIRGFSLLGILLANLLIFQYGLWGKDEIHTFDLSRFDLSAYYFLKIMIEGSFMPIFTFLFGYSMILMKEQWEKRQLKLYRHFTRRAIGLITIGLLHATYLWEGDILFSYGLTMIFLLLFLKRSNKTLLIWTISLFVLSTLFSYGALNETIYSEDEKEQYFKYIEETTNIYQNGDYTSIKDQRNNEFPIELSPGLMFVLLFMAPIFTLPMFLLGMYAGKRKWFMKPKKEKAFYQYGMIIGIPLALTLKSLYFLFPNVGWTGITHGLGSNLLAIGYMCMFAYFYSSRIHLKWLRLFENVGKLSLTNYILQTIICTTIFYGSGFGLFAKLGVAWSILVGIAIFTLQLIGSSFYFRYFKRGPLEKLTRIWTHFSFNGKAKPKKTSDTVAS